MSYDRIATAASMALNLANPPTHTTIRVKHYDVLTGTPGAITFNGTTSRLVAKYDTGSAALGSSALRFTFSYRTVGRPEGKFLNVGLRKVSGDTFTLMSQVPIETPGYPIDGSGINLNTMLGPIKTVTVDMKGNDYTMLANDKLSIEQNVIPSAAENTTQIITNMTQANPSSGFTVQQYTGSYANITGQIVGTIVDKVLVPI